MTLNTFEANTPYLADSTMPLVTMALYFKTMPPSELPPTGKLEIHEIVGSYAFAFSGRRIVRTDVTQTMGKAVGFSKLAFSLLLNGHGLAGVNMML